MGVIDPTLEYERLLHAGGHRFVIGCDEVGRGAIAGPVAVGVAMVDSAVAEIPVGLRDSKMLAQKRREDLAPRAAEWALFSAVGMSSAKEIDEIGIMAALGRAGRRALESLHAAGADVRGSAVLLDGNVDWLSPTLNFPLSVTTRIGADRDCASVAAASVIAKVERDEVMIAADSQRPGYGWAGNKGYGSAGHFAAIARLGPTPLHRHTWLKPKPANGERVTDFPARQPGLGLPQHG